MVVKVLFSSEMTRICIGCGVVKIERQGSNLEEAPYSIGQSCRLIARIEGVPVTYGFLHMVLASDLAAGRLCFNELWLAVAIKPYAWHELFDLV